MQSVSQRGTAGRTSTVQISILTHCYPFFITLQSPVEDHAATAETRLYFYSQISAFFDQFSLQGLDFTLEEFPQWLVYLPTQNPIQANPLRNTIEKIDITGKALLGLGPHREGTEWHRASHWLFPFSTSMNHEQSFSCGTPDTRVKHLVSNSASPQEMRTALPQHPSLTLMPLQQRFPWIYGTNFSSADLKSFSVYFMVI